jgi:hypothetical protein
MQKEEGRMQNEGHGSITRLDEMVPSWLVELLRLIPQSRDTAALRG